MMATIFKGNTKHIIIDYAYEVYDEEWEEVKEVICRELYAYKKGKFNNLNVRIETL